MIIYSTVSNSGGMRRIADWCARNPLGRSTGEDVLFVVFGPDLIESTKENIVFIKWKQTTLSYGEDQILHFQNILQEKISGVDIDLIIGDYQTLPYFGFLDKPLIYDVHILGRPLYSSINQEKTLAKFDQSFLTRPLNSLIDMTQFHFLKFEHKFIKKASGYLVNSQNSQFYLEQDYRDEIQGKKIFYLPLPFEFESDSQSYSERKFKYPIYTFGRLHPQKGQHILLNRDWSQYPLYVRGIELSLISAKGRAKCLSNNIHLLDWTNDSDILKKELLQSELVFFPSLYEPWGLALQEAMSLGCICIANLKAKGHSEQIQDGINGFLINMEEPNWFDKITMIMTLPMAEKIKISQQAVSSARSQGGDDKRNEEFKLLLKRGILDL